MYKSFGTPDLKKGVVINWLGLGCLWVGGEKILLTWYEITLSYLIIFLASLMPSEILSDPKPVTTAYIGGIAFLECFAKGK